MFGLGRGRGRGQGFTFRFARLSLIRQRSRVRSGDCELNVQYTLLYLQGVRQVVYSGAFGIWRLSYGRKTSRKREGIEWYSTYRSSQVFARRHGECLEAEGKWTNDREQLSCKKIITRVI